MSQKRRTLIEAVLCDAVAEQDEAGAVHCSCAAGARRGRNRAVAGVHGQKQRELQAHNQAKKHKIEES